jgi:SagB-type dehydrogenase family enzyme
MEGDWRAELSQAALDQAWVREAPTVVVITAIYERTTGKYGQRGVQYVHMEVGAAAQNLYLQAQSLGLGTVFVGAFHDDQIAALLQLGEGQVPLALLPVGRR